MSNDDIKQLDLLSIFHYVLGGITALFSCMFIAHIFMGLAMVSGKFFPQVNGTTPPSPPPFFGWIFVIMGSVAVVLGWIMAICMLISGNRLRRRKNRMFCMVIAGIECIQMPLGTVLGVFTLIALNKDSVKAVFEQEPPPLPPVG